ncbi:LCP family protein [Actinoallomurus sp. CA-150999]|uniref:LCP family protein n=1 Tax=Actinoallomurus sp. CA-150999 TaxID=3239887 RepID=UPI003D8C6673
MSNRPEHGRVGAPAYADTPGSYDHDVAPRRRRRWGRRLLIAFLVLLLLLVGVYFYLDSRLHRIDVFEDYAGRPGDTPGTNWLIVGSDSREGLSASQRSEFKTGKAAGRRTDTMMLLHIGDHGPTLVSLPRDSYLPIPGHGSNKLNAAFAFGGPKLLVRTVEQATKIHIDHYAEIGFAGFVGMTDAVGGVKMCIPEEMKDHKAGIDLKPGCQTLKGGQALGFVRSRAFARADLQRVENQRKFLSALVHKSTSPGVLLNPFRIIPFALRSTDNFAVDQDDHLYNLVGFAWAMRGITGGDGLTTTVPVGGTGSSPSAGEYITWDTQRAGTLFRDLREDQPVPRSFGTR